MLLDIIYLSDATFISGIPWQELKQVAMLADFQISNQFEAYSNEEKEKVKRLI